MYLNPDNVLRRETQIIWLNYVFYLQIYFRKMYNAITTLVILQDRRKSG